MHIYHTATKPYGNVLNTIGKEITKAVFWTWDVIKTPFT